jgi:signal peptidase I
MYTNSSIVFDNHSTEECQWNWRGLNQRKALAEHLNKAGWDVNENDAQEFSFSDITGFIFYRRLEGRKHDVVVFFPDIQTWDSMGRCSIEMSNLGIIPAHISPCGARLMKVARPIPGMRGWIKAETEPMDYSEMRDRYIEDRTDDLSLEAFGYLKQKRFPWAFIGTYTGGIFWPLEPDAALIKITDIAGALAGACRYTGTTGRHYSVAEHSIRIAQEVSARYRLHALLHDGEEAYSADVAAPFKFHIQDLNRIQSKIRRAIWDAFDMEPYMPEPIKGADRLICNDERQVLLPWMPLTWGQAPGLGIADEIRNNPMSREDARIEFLRLFKELTKDRHIRIAKQ